MAGRIEIFWDWSKAGNAAHIAENDVTPEEVEEALGRGFEDRVSNRSEPGRWVVRDFTDAGRFLVVSFELERVAELENSWLITPVTAFQPIEEA